MDRRPHALALVAGRSSARPGGSDAGASGGFSMSSTGTSIDRSSRGFSPASTMATGRGLPFTLPPRKRAIASSGRCVADSPMRCGSRPVSSTSRSSDSMRCAPRLPGASAWISSTMTVSTVAQDARAPATRATRYSDSGVVMRMSPGARASCRRCFCGRVAGADADADLHAAARRAPRRRARCRPAARAGCARRRRPAP